MLHVIATVEIASGRREEFLTEFNRVVGSVREEDGCLEYGPAVDLGTNISVQPPIRADTVVIIEKWRDLEALEKHLIAPHMLDYRGRVKELVRSAVIQILEPA